MSIFVRGARKKARGAAIMLALWALFLLSALVISWALDIDTRLSISGEGTRILKAEAAACSGAEVALHPVVNPGSPNLQGQFGEASYDARLTGEGGKLQINYLAGPAGEAGVEVLRRYLENKGIDLNERDLMVDSLLDWVQPNTGLHRLNAPPESDTYHPPHQPLSRVDELKEVAGWADFTSQPGWDDDFTVVNVLNKIDLQWASRDVLLALPGMTPEVVDRFLQLRQGPDGVDGTADDMQFKDVPDALRVLGVSREQFEKSPLANLVTVRVPVLRVVSVGTAGHAKRTVEMVFMRGNVGAGSVTNVFSWKEF